MISWIIKLVIWFIELTFNLLLAFLYSEEGLPAFDMWAQEKLSTTQLNSVLELLW